MHAILLFIRAHSDLNVEPLDWVASKAMMEHQPTDPQDSESLPTQVMVCELLRFLELTLAPNGKRLPRVALLVTAWDLLDEEDRNKGPTAYIRQQFPLLAGRLIDCTKLEVRLFGMSVLGGDLKHDAQFISSFRSSSSIDGLGYVVSESGTEIKKHSDITLPLAWLIKN